MTTFDVHAKRQKHLENHKTRYREIHTPRHKDGYESIVKTGTG